MTTTNNKTLIGTGRAMFALVAAGFLALKPAEAATAVREPGGVIRFYDDRGQDRGYEWCLKLSGLWNSGSSDCRFVNYEQCRASIVAPGGACELNPFSYEVTPPPAKRARR